MKYLIFLIAILITIPSFARVKKVQTKCPNFKKSIHIKEIYLLEDNINCDTISIYNQTIDDLSKLSSIKIPLITFSLSKSGDDAMNRVEHIEIPDELMSFDQNGEYILSNNLKLNYLAHEYGHSIFNKFIEQEFKELRPALEGIQYFNELYFDRDDAEIAHNQQKVDELSLQIDNEELDFYTNDEILSPLKHILTYSELFSDLVSVLYSNDLQGFAKTFYRDGSNQSFIERASFRDFSASHDLETWTNSDRYSFFAPTKSFIGTFLNFPMSIEDKKRFLKNMSKIICEQIRETWQKEELSPKHLNQRLINRINKALAEGDL